MHQPKQLQKPSCLPISAIGHRIASALSGMVLVALVFCFVGSAVYSSKANVSADNGDASLVSYLNQEKQDLIRIASETISIKDDWSLAIIDEKIKQNEAMQALVQSKIDTLNGFLDNHRKQQKQLSKRISRLTSQLSHNANDLTIRAQIKTDLALNVAMSQIITLISDNLTIAHKYELTLANDHRLLLGVRIKRQGAQRLDALHKQIDLLYKERSALYKNNVLLQQDQHDVTDFKKTYDGEVNRQLNNRRIALINAQVNLLELQIKLIRMDELLVKPQDVKTISSTIDAYKDAIDQLEDIQQSLMSTLGFLKSEQPFVSNPMTKQRAANLQLKVNVFLKEVNEWQQRINGLLAEQQQQLKKQLSVRQTVLAFQENGWGTVKAEFSRAPVQIAKYSNGLLQKFMDGYSHLQVWSKVFWGLLILLIFGVSIWIKRAINALNQDKTRQRISGHLYDAILVLLARNITQFGLLAAVLVLFVSVQIPHANYRIVVDLFLLWFVFRNLIFIAQLILLDRQHELSSDDARLFYRLKYLFMTGGITIMLMVFSEQLPLSMLIQDICTRLFMVFIFASSLVLWLGKDVFPLLLRPLLKTKKRYLKNAVNLLFLLLPLTLFTTAIIGLMGYMNMAWSLSRYQAYFVLVIVGYVMMRGLLSDLMELISEWMLSMLRNGWLWIEVLLKPIDMILHLVLFFASVILLFQLFGVYTEMPVLTWLKRVGDYELVNVSGVHITMLSSLEFIMVLSVFVWASKWTREFCYRWLYRNSRDEGVRNSLSVFTQYAVILLGGYITLRVLGLDFSGMSMILGGLAVGMGFGLRDFASNIVGGVMLLIERPVREGDLITIGSHEGRVAHIGIRSMRVSSWDNTEVLIPNAETFNKPFINWTHQDSIVRTVVPIKICRTDDPSMIQQLIFDVLSIIPEIMNEPPPQVFLKQIDEALIEFEIRYFINIQLYTRFEIRSKVLFAIMAQFKAAGVSPPIPPLSIEIKDLSHGDLHDDHRTT